MLAGHMIRAEGAPMHGAARRAAWKSVGTSGVWGHAVSSGNGGGTAEGRGDARNATAAIEGDTQVTVDQSAKVDVREQLSVDTGGFEHVSGPYDVRATSVSIEARDELSLSGDTIRIEAGTKLELVCGGTKLTLTPGGPTLQGGKVTISGGEIAVKADGTVDVDGALITLN